VILESNDEEDERRIAIFVDGDAKNDREKVSYFSEIGRFYYFQNRNTSCFKSFQMIRLIPYDNIRDY